MGVFLSCLAFYLLAKGFNFLGKSALSSQVSISLLHLPLLVGFHACRSFLGFWEVGTTIDIHIRLSLGRTFGWQLAKSFSFSRNSQNRSVYLSRISFPASH